MATDFKSILPEERERFWSRLDIRSPNDCWEWKGATQKPCDRGLLPYGFFNRMQRKEEGRKAIQYNAHRFVMMMQIDCELPRDVHVMHSCDNPRCVNPAHLRLGTASDNMRDAISKGRMIFRGSTSPRHRLSQDQAREMLASCRTAREAKEKFKISYGMFYRIRKIKAVADGRGGLIPL